MHFNLGYDDIGQNYEETIILIGGLGTQRTVWPDNFCEELLKNKYRVIRFDNRDIGEMKYIKPFHYHRKYLEFHCHDVHQNQ